MINFTYKNHLKYSIGEVYFSARTNPYEHYRVEVGSIDKDYFKTSTPASEMLRIAELVNNELNKDFVVFFSGGTDSEITLKSFLKIGIKPKCMMVRLRNDHNLHDVIVAEKICNDLGVSLYFIDFDVHEFMYSGEAREFSKSIQCTQITFSMIYNCILKLAQPVVMGGSIPLVKSVRNGKIIWYYAFRENEEGSAIRFSNTYNIPVINEWFSYTPESMLHFLINPHITEVAENKAKYKLSIESTKNKALVTYFDDISYRSKTHGFEKLIPFNIECYRSLASSQILRLTSCLDGIEYNEVISKLKTQI